jgi:class 3 adenylate cyclase/tetratricopeptide (TPR) repeat protein
MRVGGGTVFRFEGHRLDLQRGSLSNIEGEVELRPKCFELLRYLVENAGRLVSKDEVIEALWPNRTITDEALARTVSDLRLALKDKSQRILKTLPRRGFMLAAPVSEAPQAEGQIEVDGTTPAVMAQSPAPASDAPSRAARRTDAAGDRPAPAEAGAEQRPAERRLLTVMACELVGLAGLSTALDPEDLRELTAACHRFCAEIIERHHGVVAHYSGDGVVAYFGYLQTREHDSERAVRAGLALADAVPRFPSTTAIPLEARIGIATGPVVISDTIGIDAPYERAVIGEAPNLATRLQALAEPGAVVISSGTRRLTGGLFDYRGLGPIVLAGSSDTVSAWFVSGPSARENRFAALRSSTIPLVGRGEEVALLLRRWDQAKAGDGQVVLISGEPGIGKSRLAETLLQSLIDEPHTRLRYFCSPHHQDSALWPAIRQFEHAAGFRRDDSADCKLAKIEALLSLSSNDLDTAVPLAANLLSVPTGDHYPALELTPQKHKEKTLRTELAQIEGLAAARPVLIWYEDLHWSDPMTRESLDLLVDRAAALRVLVILTFRPEFAAAWVGRPNVTLLSLNRLPPRRGAEMILHVAGGKALPDDIAAQIIDRTDGVPLFIEELTKSVLESGALEVSGGRYSAKGPVSPPAIPTSLQASLLARLDRLPSTREVVQIAATFGCEFSHELIGAVAALPETQLDHALAQLVQSELILRRGTPPDAVYSFKHALVRDAADSTLLRSQRRHVHGRIVIAIESRFPEVATSQPERLGRHAAEAGLMAKAVAYWLTAGRQARRRSALAEAEALCRKGLAALAGLPDHDARAEQELNLRLTLTPALIYTKGFAAVEVGENLTLTRTLCDQLDRPLDFMRLSVSQWAYHLTRAELNIALTLAEEIENIGGAQKDAGLQSEARYPTATTHFVLGEFTSVQAVLAPCFSRAEPEGPSETSAASTSFAPHVAMTLATALAYLGYVDQARSRSKDALTALRRHGRAQIVAVSLHWALMIDELTLSPDLERHSDELFAHSMEHGFPFFAAVAKLSRGGLLSVTGRAQEGLVLIRQGVLELRAMGAALYIARALTALARAHAGLGQLAEGLDCVAEASEIVETTGQRFIQPWLYLARGALHSLGGDVFAAEQSYCHALDVARRQCARPVELKAAISLARLWYDQGKRAEARDLLAPICGWFTEGFDLPDLIAAKALLTAIRAQTSAPAAA